MKKILLFVLMGFGILNLSKAQVIELTGMGVADEDGPVTLTFSDPGTIEKVVVEAAAVFRNYKDKDPDDVAFYRHEGENIESSFILTEQDYAPSVPNGGQQKWGYYTAEFDGVDADGITLDKKGQGEHIISFTAYVYRSGNGPEIYHTVKYEHGFVFRNGSEDPLIYNFTIPTSLKTRDIEVEVPLSELTDGDRYGVVKLSAGDATTENTFYNNNKGSLLRLDTLVLKGVAGNVNNARLEFYSPDTKDGDSFITGSVLLKTTVKEGGCTLTQGYWKTHSIYGPARHPDPTWDLIGESGPDELFFLSGKSYIEVLNTPPAGGNAYYTLAHQYIAAELNFLNGATNSAVMDEFEDATVLFTEYMPEDIASLKGKNGKELKEQFTRLAEKLDDYNNGITGPGHCDEIEDGYANEKEKGEKQQKPEPAASLNVKVNPNPVKNNARIAFKPAFDGNARVELFDSMGNKRSLLYNRKVRKNEKVQFMFHARKFKAGTYVLVFTNGKAKSGEKIKIGK